MPEHIRDIYYTRKYYKMYELSGDGKGKLFVYYNNSGDMALYPFMLKEIQGYDIGNKYYDIETAYGYGGPVLNCVDKSFIKDFEDSFIKYCKANNIVAEFVRFHPLIKNQNVFCKDIEVLHNRITVQLDLTKSLSDIWNEDIKSKNRNMIRKAKKTDCMWKKVRILKSSRIYTKVRWIRWMQEAIIILTMVTMKPLNIAVIMYC